MRAIPIIRTSRAEPPGAGNHADALLGKGKPGGLRDDAKIAGERELESHAEAVAANCGQHRLVAALGGGDVPGKLRDSLRGAVQESADVAAAGEVLPLAAQHDDSYLRVAVQGLEHRAKLVALAHGHDVERRAVEHHVRTLAGVVDLDAEAVEVAREVRSFGTRSTAQWKFLAACQLLDAGVGEIGTGRIHR